MIFWVQGCSILFLKFSIHKAFFYTFSKYYNIVRGGSGKYFREEFKINPRAKIRLDNLLE